MAREKEIFQDVGVTAGKTFSRSAGSQRCRVDMSTSIRIGLSIRASIPLARALSRQPPPASAVMAIIGVWRPGGSRLRISVAASCPFIKGIWQSINTRSRSEEHTSELQSLRHLVCRLLLEKK